MHLLAIAAVALLPPTAGLPPPDAACAPRPLPAALDSVAPPGFASGVIAFSAAPSLEWPGHAWVVRLFRRGTVSATAEVIRLRRRNDCNLYVVERRWVSPLRREEFQALTARITSYGIPSVNTFSPDDLQADALADVIGTDGTALELRLNTIGWRVTRILDHHSADGAALSALFRSIVARHVSADQMPLDDWRSVGR